MDNRKTEFSVGVFLLVGLACLAYLSLKLGQVRIWGDSEYLVQATFSTVSGLKTKSAVTMAGVNIGRVEKIQLQGGSALVSMRISKDVKLEEDVIASIKTNGIIGDKYISITPGASDTYIPKGGKIVDTQPPVDLEELIGKYVFGKV
ncbi:MAG TPA: outer membrane lipid asymmetry maintenance protein MlaD [Syntrophobacteraceae bacterium]|nr:outer membrane lipid asymmetry maintenance protein MlaD [Syntrophobacteraceae bacterium]HBD09809.1 outer membrane lipid asymmetry maintenance protein MlaD [Syntrophobacteraceae bacterium]HBZ54241.1 outer membrane lipid asymmetry maintenance protein MlaD [Syntrophobacteraceae bacterium]